MKNIFLAVALLIVVVGISGCAIPMDPKLYQSNGGAQAAYLAGQADRQAYEQSRLEAQAYRDGLGTTGSNVNIGIGITDHGWGGYLQSSPGFCQPNPLFRFYPGFYGRPYFHH